MRDVIDLDRSPMVAIWEVTRACDLCCLHCRASAKPERDSRELSTAEAYELIAQLCELEPRVVVLTGGDPLKRHDLFAIIARAVERGLTVAITPSVTPLLTADVVRRFADAGISRIALSLDGPQAATHDGLRGVTGSFDTTLRAIAAVRTANVPLQINSSLTRSTLPELPAMGRLMSRIAPALWSVFFVVPVGRATIAQQLDAYACESAFLYLHDWSETTGLAVKTTAAPAYRRVVLEQRAKRRREGRPAPAYGQTLPGTHPPSINDGKGFIFVSHTGEVYPSGFLPLAVGNVRSQHLATIYRTSPLLLALRQSSLLEGKCGVCEFRAVCGGSRARAFAATGNVLAEDPACAYVPRSRGALTADQPGSVTP